MRDVELGDFLDNLVSDGGFHVVDEKGEIGFTYFSIFLDEQFWGEMFTLNSNVHHRIGKGDFNKNPFEIGRAGGDLP